MHKETRFLIGFIVVCVCCSDAMAQVQIPTVEQEEMWEIMRPLRTQQNLDEFRQGFSMNQAIQNPSMFAIIRLMEGDDELANHFGLVDLQREELADLKNELSKQVKSIKEDAALTDQQKLNKLAIAKHKVGVKVAEVLLPKQLKKLQKWDIDTAGLPKLLVKTEIGNALELTDKQKGQIKTKSDALAKRIREMVGEFRQEAADIVIEELTDSQIDSLGKIYSNQRLREYFESIPITMLHNQYLFELPDDAINNNPGMLLYQSDLDLKNLAEKVKKED